jgi:peptidoglycan/LPS O-acetylase OafA/YrhL
VVVFFVLSGFVIRHVTDTKEMHWPDYAASRIARIFSVTVPAIFLTLICDAIGRAVEPAIYAHSASGQVLARVVLSLLLLNEVWLMSVMSFSNLPFWSICVEFWYYAAFALVVFLPRRKGWVAAALLALRWGRSSSCWRRSGARASCCTAGAGRDGWAGGRPSRWWR